MRFSELSMQIYAWMQIAAYRAEVVKTRLCIGVTSFLLCRKLKKINHLFAKTRYR